MHVVTKGVVNISWDDVFRPVKPINAAAARFGSRLRRHRQSARMHEGFVAERLAFSVSDLRMYEAGAALPSPERLRWMVDLYGVQADEMHLLSELGEAEQQKHAAARRKAGEPSTYYGGVFLSYRRGDSAPFAARLYGRLVQELGEKRVFVDVDTIDLGRDFVRVLDVSLNLCNVMLVIIGRQWATATNQSGMLRLHDPEDFVRQTTRCGVERTA